LPAPERDVSEGYTILSLDEVETVRTLGFRAVGVDARAADSGGQLVPPREEESGNEELYAVVRGRATFAVGDAQAHAPAGTLVFVPPNVSRTAVAEEDGTLAFVVYGTAGEAFQELPG
jgi:mannose-6-phosphate isomerase-like protein (cupin superfamily)